jgi:predicted nucleic acid-binding protein
VKPGVLADTGPLYAAADPDDAHHKRAHQELQRLASEKVQVAIAYPTLLEAYTLVLFRLGKSVATRWLSNVTDASLVNPTPDDYRLAMAKVQALADQPITLFDAVVATLATRSGLEVWTYDHHFDLMRVAVWR